MVSYVVFCIVFFKYSLYHPPPRFDAILSEKSGYFDNLNKGDWVMADKGFTIQDDLATVGARLVIPSFLQSRHQFCKRETEHSTLHDVAPDVWIVVACFSNFLPPLIN